MGGPIFTLVLQKVERKVVCVLNGSLLAENAGYCKFVNGEHTVKVTSLLIVALGFNFESRALPE